MEDNEVRFRGGAVFHSGEAHIGLVCTYRNKAKEEAGGAHTQNVAGTSVVNLTKTLFYKNAVR